MVPSIQVEKVEGELDFHDFSFSVSPWRRTISAGQEKVHTRTVKTGKKGGSGGKLWVMSSALFGNGFAPPSVFLSLSLSQERRAGVGERGNNGAGAVYCS